MSDDIDIASEREEMLRSHALRYRKRAGPPWTGRCANCDDPVEIPLRWCDANCRDEWDSRGKR